MIAGLRDWWCQITQGKPKDIEDKKRVTDMADQTMNIIKGVDDAHTELVKEARRHSPRDTADTLIRARERVRLNSLITTDAPLSDLERR